MESVNLESTSYKTGAMLNIQVCYALPDIQTLVYLQLPVGTMLYDAILASKISSIHPQIHLAHQRVGVFGQVRSLYSVLENGDRVEIYRPLIVDPKLARSLVVQKRRTKHDILPITIAPYSPISETSV